VFLLHTICCAYYRYYLFKLPTTT